MANKDIKFLDLKIEKYNVDEIERVALQRIRERALNIYMSKDDTVACSWIEAVLEYLYQQGLKNIEVVAND